MENDRDAFAGGFVAGIVDGKPLGECIDMGHWLASLSIKELGPQYVTPFFSSPNTSLILYTPSVSFRSPIDRTIPLPGTHSQSKHTSQPLKLARVPHRLIVA